VLFLPTNGKIYQGFLIMTRVMKKLLYVCVTCGQDFTRKYRAYRHNKNIHFGTAQIVRFFEYLIQRSAGKYLPSDPLPYRLKRRQNAFTNNNTYHTELPSQGNVFHNKLLFENSQNAEKIYADLFNFNLLQSTHHKKAVEQSPDAYKQGRAKLAAIEQLLTPFCPPEFVRNVISALIRWTSIQFPDRQPNRDRRGSCDCSSRTHQCETLICTVHLNERSL
jgi:hypothetical protein